MRERCPWCGLPLERGEQKDYWLGAQMFNLVVAELLFAGMLAVLAVATWPNVPRTLLQYGGVALVTIASFAPYPFSRTTWLAWDPAFRPRRRDE